MDTESSGRRRRHRRNIAAAAETWPNDHAMRGSSGHMRGSSGHMRGSSGHMRGSSGHMRGASAHMRGALTSMRGMPQYARSVSQQFLYHDDILDRESLDPRSRVSFWVSTATGTSSRGSPSQRGSQASQRGAQANQRGAQANQRGAQANQRGAQANQRGARANQRGVQWSQRGSASNLRGPQANQRRSSATQRRTSRQGGDGAAASANEGRTPSDQRGSYANQRGSQTNLRGTTNRRGREPTGRGTPAPPRWSGQGWVPPNQGRTSLTQRGSGGNRRGLPVNRRGTGDNRRGTGDNRRGTGDNQRGTADNQRGTVSPRQTDNLEGPSWFSRLLAWLPGGNAITYLKWLLGIKAEAVQEVKRESKEKEKDDAAKQIVKDHVLDDKEKPSAGETSVTDAVKQVQDPETLMFRDGKRSIDMVLAYIQEDPLITLVETVHSQYRNTFQENLIKEGLELELEHKHNAYDGKTWFLKIHIPWHTQRRIAEVIGLKLPVKQFLIISAAQWPSEEIKFERRWYVRWRRRVKWIFENKLIKPGPQFYAGSSVHRGEQFLVKEREKEFSPSQRSLLVMQILLRTRYAEGSGKVCAGFLTMFSFTETLMLGIKRLLADGSYLSCYPLHEGEYNKSKPDGTYTDRQLLYREWAQPMRWYKWQPLWLVRRYFGDKIGLYYAWLGFYTQMLVAPAVVGSLCFLYGLATMDSSDNIPSMEICDAKGPGNITLCPLCDKACGYQKLHESCFFAQLTHLIDNPATVFFAMFMSFWATTFLMLWKREQAVIGWEWDLGGMDFDDNPRPDFETSVKTRRVNPITGEREPYLAPSEVFVRHVITSTTVLLMISLALSAVLGTIIYRISMVAVIYGGSGFFIRTYARLFTTLTAALINLVIIEILNRLYKKLSVILTNLENPRTQAEYDDSYTFKMFFFECVNFYSTLFYIAFFKGAFFDHPGDHEARKSPILKLKGDICFPVGCMSELSIQLAVVMIGKQMVQNFWEMAKPAIQSWWRYRRHRAETLDLNKPYMMWEIDYHFEEPDNLELFREYLEMVMQYGFVTMFVAALPLGPLFALLNNVCEIRMDAYKMISQARRPLAERAVDIGAWYGVLRLITYVAVATNAFVIAYTSDFIPRMVYKYGYSPNHTLAGYVTYSLSWFNTSDYQEDWGTPSEYDPPQCAYRGYRNPPTHPEPYGLSPYYWHVFAARLMFVVVFEHVVFSVTDIMQTLIAPVPEELSTQIHREAQMEKELKYGSAKRRHGLTYNKSIVEVDKEESESLSRDEKPKEVVT